MARSAGPVKHPTLSIQIQTLVQCVQIFFVEMRKILLKMCEKMRQPKMSTFYCIFGRFRVRLLFENFLPFIFLKIKLNFTT